MSHQGIDFRCFRCNFGILQEAVENLPKDIQNDLSGLPSFLHSSAMREHYRNLGVYRDLLTIYVQSMDESMQKIIRHVYDAKTLKEIQTMADSLPGLKTSVTEFQQSVQSQLDMLPDVDSREALQQHQLSLGSRPVLSGVTPILQQYRSSENSVEKEELRKAACVIAYNVFKAQATWDGKGINEHSILCMADAEIDCRLG